MDHVHPSPSPLPEIANPRRYKQKQSIYDRDYTVSILRAFLILETLIEADKHNKGKTREELLRFVMRRVGAYSSLVLLKDLNCLCRLGFVKASNLQKEVIYFYNPRNFIREGGAR